MQALRLHPLGDQALLAYLPDEDAAAKLADRARRAEWPWLVDVVQAYASVAVFYDSVRTEAATVEAALQGAASGEVSTAAPGQLHAIPCCYEQAPDLERVAAHAGLPVDEVIRLHTAAVYTVYAIGFCPGFPYLGYLPEALCGVPRLASPRLRVEKGSVGLTGRQTGIYTEARPGGWNLIGRTPLKLVDVAEGYFPLRTGDRVQFQAIDRATFDRMREQRL